MLLADEPDREHTASGERDRRTEEFFKHEDPFGVMTKSPVPEISHVLFTSVDELVQVACLGNPDPVGLKVYAPNGEETFDDIQTTEEAQAGADRREAA